MNIAKSKLRARKYERGVTIVLVAFTLIALLSMAALAIDVTTLYVARGEAQRAANAAALAGAKIFVTSGFTSIQSASSPAVDQDDACQTGAPTLPGAANRVAAAVAAQNQVAGKPATILRIDCDFTQILNPKITVTVRQTGLPTFFARIWGSSVSSVKASAIAEAYNASGLSTPIIMTSVKPWLVPNCDPTAATVGACIPASGYFVNNTGGTIASSSAFIGTNLTLLGINTGTPGRIAPATSPPGLTFYQLDFPVIASPPPLVCPSTSAVSCSLVGTGNTYRDNIACSSPYPFYCGQVVKPGNPVQVKVGAVTGTRSGTRCLIHATGDDTAWPGGFTSLGQDLYPFSTVPVQMNGGTLNPNPLLRSVTNISRSDSVVTAPLYDGTSPCLGAGCQIIGFLQLGIRRTISAGGSPPNPHFEAKILNVAGCSAASIASAPPPLGSTVSGGGVAPIPVRLIH